MLTPHVKKRDIFWRYLRLSQEGSKRGKKLWFTTNKFEKRKSLLLLISLVQILLCWVVQESTHRLWWSRHPVGTAGWLPALCWGWHNVWLCQDLHPSTFTLDSSFSQWSSTPRLCHLPFAPQSACFVFCSECLKALLMDNTSLCCPGGVCGSSPPFWIYFCPFSHTVNGPVQLAVIRLLKPVVSNLEYQ